MSPKDEHSAGDWKFIAQTLDIVQASNPSGFLASGARMKEQPEVEEEIKRMGDAAIKCPRCWNIHSVHGNPLDCCDRCMLTVTSMLPELVADGRWTQESADEWRGLVQAMRDRWKA